MTAAGPQPQPARDELAARFFDALREGDVEGLRELLAADVQMVGDGGGNAPQWANGIFGAEKVTRVLASAFPGSSGSGGRPARRELPRPGRQRGQNLDA